MGTIYKNGIKYGGSGDNIQVYTIEEYEQIKDTIPEGTKYIISDDIDESNNIINNEKVSGTTTWSSEKINSELDNKTSNNFGTQVEIEFETEFICPSNGIVTVGSYGDQSWCNLKVNNNLIFTLFSKDAARGYLNSWRVNKGDKILISGTDSTVVHIRKFIPSI